MIFSFHVQILTIHDRLNKFTLMCEISQKDSTEESLYPNVFLKRYP
jgi:hypothetical protein